MPRAKHSFRRDISELYHFAVWRMDAFRGAAPTFPFDKARILPSPRRQTGGTFLFEFTGKRVLARSSEIKLGKRQRDGGMFSIYFPKGRAFSYSPLVYARSFPFAPLFVLRISSRCTGGGECRTDGSREGFCEARENTRGRKFKNLQIESDSHSCAMKCKIAYLSMYLGRI